MKMHAERLKSRKYEYGVLAKDFAFSKLFSGGSLEARRKKIAQRLGLMHGLPQKMGQILGFRDGEEDFENPFSELSEGMGDLSVDEFQDLLVHRMGAEILENISWMAPNGISASLGQTHEARLRGGERVAIKQQYPGIKDIVKEDLQSFGWLLKPVGTLGRSFDIQALKSEIGEMIDSELDYELEASWLRRFNYWIEPDPIVSIPSPIDSMSGPEVLTMSWVYGESHRGVSQWPLNLRRKVSEQLLRFFLRSTCVWGAVHTDPHSGNFRFSRDGLDARVGLVDFGSVKALSSQFALGYRQLVESAVSGDFISDELPKHFENLGFDMNMLEPLSGKLEQLARLLLAPFHSSDRFDLSSWNLSDELKRILGSERMQFRAAAPVDLIFWIRAFHGMVRYLDAFSAPISWREVALETLSMQPVVETEVSDVARNSTSLVDDSLAAKVCLKIEVRRNGKQTAAIELPGRSLRNLENLIPEDVKESLKGGESSVLRIKQKAIADGYVAGPLFSCEESVKQVRVWLEEKP